MIANPYESPQPEASPQPQRTSWFRIVFWIVFWAGVVWVIDTLNQQLFTLDRSTAKQKLQRQIDVVPRSDNPTAD